MHALLDAITGTILQAESRGEPIGPAGVSLLVRRYAATGRADVAAALERALSAAVPFDPDGAGAGLAAWVEALCEAAAVSDDPRIVAAVADGAAALRRRWPARGPVADAMRSVDACLQSAAVVGGGREPIAAAIDELERIVGVVYAPGEPLAGSIARPDEGDGTLDDHAAAAAALLTAHDLTARLPYPMLAEELVQPRHRGRGDTFAARCALGRVLCRLARLHDDADYRAAAVVARGRDYRADARQLIEDLSASYGDHGADAAILALAADDLARAS